MTQKQALDNPAKALSIARAIEDGWYRCQAITSVVEAHPSRPDAEALLDEAIAAAYSQIEPNRVVSVAPWPLRMLLSINRRNASGHLRKLLELIAAEPHGLRRLHGQGALLHLVIADVELRVPVLAMFTATAKGNHGWRTDRAVSLAACSLAAFDPDAAEILLESRPQNQFTNNARKHIAELRQLKS